MMSLSSIYGHKLENHCVGETTDYLGIVRIVSDSPSLYLVVNWTDAAQRTV